MAPHRGANRIFDSSISFLSSSSYQDITYHLLGIFYLYRVQSINVFVMDDCSKIISDEI